MIPAKLQLPDAANMPSEADRFGTFPLHLRQWIDHQLIEPLDAQFWAKIYSMDTASTECLSEVQALLICPFKIEAARSLRGNEAQKFIDFLDRVSTKIMCPILRQLRTLIAGPCVLIPRRQTPAAGFTTSFQDLQST